jgi:hypothetical protein
MGFCRRFCGIFIRPAITCIIAKMFGKKESYFAVRIRCFLKKALSPVFYEEKNTV